MRWGDSSETIMHALHTGALGSIPAPTTPTPPPKEKVKETNKGFKNKKTMKNSINKIP